MINRRENLIFYLLDLNFFNKKRLFFLSIFLLFLFSIFFKFFSFYIPYFGINLSFESVPIIVVGSYFGPVVGFFYGIFSDLAGIFLLGLKFPFFWMYTLQSALIGFISGFCPLIFLNFWKKNFSKIFLSFLSFFIACILFFFWMFRNSNENYFFIFFTLFLYIPISIFYLWKFFYKDKKLKSSFIYVLFLFLTLSFFVSFLFGTYSSLEYVRVFFLHDYNFQNFFIFLSSRIFKEIIKAPILITFLISVFSIYSPLERFKNKI